MGHYMDLARPKRAVAEYVEVEVLIEETNHYLHFMTLRLEEDSDPITIPLWDVEILKQNLPYATIRLKERKAIDYDLI